MDGTIRMTHAQRLALVFILFSWSAILGLTCSGCSVPVLEAPYCEAPLVTDKIVGGEVSVDRRSTVFVELGGGYCSGTIIGPHTVLTAGHCEGAESILVEDVAWFEVEADVVNPDYAFPFSDLRVLHTLDVLPEPYAVLATDEVVCSRTIAQGYGRGGGGDLHEREVFEAGHVGGQIFNSTAIAPGDSGGPLWAITDAGPVLLGVASWGFGGEEVNYEGGTGHISVPFHTQWITENIK